MAIIIDGSNGISDVDGSASIPSICGTDSNTGIYFPAADQIGFTTNGTIRGRWTNSGLCFGSDTAAVNALDDYEEGTWTPAFGGSTTNPTVSYTTQAGQYTKIGRQVFFNCLIIISSVSSQGTGNIHVTGLPFSSDATGYSCVANIGYNDVFDTAFKDCYVSQNFLVVIPTGVTQANVVYGTAAAGASNLSSGYLSITGSYFTT